MQALYIPACGCGHHSSRLAHTILSNEDNEQIRIPNKHIVGEIIHNSQADSIIELSVRIAYESDPQQAISVIQDALKQNNITIPVPQREVRMLGDRGH